jgi:hypothetical protein
MVKHGMELGGAWHGRGFVGFIVGILISLGDVANECCESSCTVLMAIRYC